MTPFEVLEVPLDVDDASLRRAYARAVRAHPPESDGEGFQRVAEAFAALEDTQARAALAAMLRAEQEAPEVTPQLERALALAQGGDLEQAQALLKGVVQRFPGHAGARSVLLRMLQQLERPNDALAVAQAWGAHAPGALEPLLLQIELLVGRYDYPEALALLERAEAHFPADRRVPFERAQLLEQQEKWEPALAEYARTLSLSDASTLSDVRVVAQRLQLHARRGQAEAAQAEIALIVAGATTDEGRATASTVLTLLAGHALEHQGALAAQLFAAARTVDPQRRRFELGLPRSTPEADLPQASRDLLVQTRATASPLALYVDARSRQEVQLRRATFGAMALFVVSAALGLPPWALLLLAVLMVALPIEAQRRRGQRLGAAVAHEFLLLRPLHLLRVHAGLVQAIPLLRLRKLVPQGATLTVEVDGEPQLVVVGTRDAQPFAVHVSQQVRRLISLARADVLEAELDTEPLHWS